MRIQTLVVVVVQFRLVWSMRIPRYYQRRGRTQGLVRYRVSLPDPVVANSNLNLRICDVFYLELETRELHPKVEFKFASVFRYSRTTSIGDGRS